MRSTSILAALAMTTALIISAPLAAHEAGKGRNGGVRVDAGKSHHTELVVDGTTKVVVYLSDVNDKPIPAAGFKATAILVIDGKSQRFDLAPAEASQMTGTAPAPVKPGVKGVVRLTTPDGQTVQGKF